MATRFIKTEEDMSNLVKLIGHLDMPFTASLTAGVKRSDKQNRLQRKWIAEIAEQLPQGTAEEWRGYCKLHIGIPILRNENDAFQSEYDEVIKPLPYEAKMKLMMVPFDFGVTRIMTTKQKKSYLDQVQRFFAEQGVVLTDPEANHGVTFSERESA